MHLYPGPSKQIFIFKKVILFLNAYINRHVHAEYLECLNYIDPLAYSMFFYIVLMFCAK